MDRNSITSRVVPTLVGIAFILTGALCAANPQAPSSPVAHTQAQFLTANQLTDLVAPIALYPDGLLSQVLVASTYPLEVVEAQQWLQRNSTLRGTKLIEAAKQKSWDPSVQALVAFPDVLNLLNQDIDWTMSLGNAILARQADVMAAVQQLRSSAQANGHLTSTPQQTVSTENQGGQTGIVIQPANPDVIYVPAYDPTYVWGPPVWGYYPSLYYPTFGFGWWPVINIGFCFGGWSGWGGWGWGPNWFGHTIFVNNVFFHQYGFHGVFGAGVSRFPWSHDPGHRLGVPYPNQQLTGRYQAASVASRANSSRLGGSNSTSPSNGGSRFQGGGGPENLSNANHPAISRNPGNAQAFRGTSPQVSPPGGATRNFQLPRSMPMPSAPHGYPNFNSGAMRGFGGGHNFGGFPGGGHSFGGFQGHGGFGGGHSFGGGGGHGHR